MDTLPRMQAQSDAVASGLPMAGTFPAPLQPGKRWSVQGWGTDLGQDGCSFHSPPSTQLPSLALVWLA